MMKLALSKRERRVILSIGGLTLLTGWVYAAYIVGPLTREAARLGWDVQSARAQLAALETVMSHEPALQTQYRQWDDKVKVLRNQLPAQEELPAVLDLLSGFAAKSQVKIQAIFSQRPTEEAQGAKSAKPNAPPADPVVYKDIVIQVDALAGYHQLGRFLSLVESGGRPMRLASLRMAGNPKEPKRHHIRMLIRAYFSTGGSASNPS